MFFGKKSKRLKLEFDPGEVGAVGMEILQNQNGPKVWATLSMLFSGIPSLAMFTAHSQLAKYLGGPQDPQEARETQEA